MNMNFKDDPAPAYYRARCSMSSLKMVTKNFIPENRQHFGNTFQNTHCLSTNYKTLNHEKPQHFTTILLPGTKQNQNDFPMTCSQIRN